MLMLLFGIVKGERIKLGGVFANGVQTDYNPRKAARNFACQIFCLTAAKVTVVKVKVVVKIVAENFKLCTS